MQLAPITGAVTGPLVPARSIQRPFMAPLPTTKPATWMPGVFKPDTATRAGGLLKGGLDVYRGKAERAHGVALTSTQINAIAPFLAAETRLDPVVVRRDLTAVRIQVGGLAKGAGGTATTIGPNIYVSDAARAARILSWEGRGWLVHELTHTMQWRRVGVAQAADGAARDKAFLNKYLGGFVHKDGDLGAGAIARALTALVRKWGGNAHDESVAEDLHDQHPMELEAAQVAAKFRGATGG